MVDHPATPRNLGDKDAPHMSPVTPAEDARTIMLNRISWGAVLAGVVTALVTQLILNMLGIGIGVATLDPATGTTRRPRPSPSRRASGGRSRASSPPLRVAIWPAALGPPKESTAGFHGLIAWAATTLVIFYLLTSTLGSLLGGAYNTLSSAVGGLGRTAVQTAAPALAQNPIRLVLSSSKCVMHQAGNDPAQLRDTAITSLRAMLTGDQAQAQQARDRATAALARAQNISPEEARNRVTQYEQQYRQTVDRAKQAADTCSYGCFDRRASRRPRAHPRRIGRLVRRSLRRCRSDDHVAAPRRRTALNKN
jgi:hypothetical protein